MIKGANRLLIGALFIQLFTSTLAMAGQAEKPAQTEPPPSQQQLQATPATAAPATGAEPEKLPQAPSATPLATPEAKPAPSQTTETDTTVKTAQQPVAPNLKQSVELPATTKDSKDSTDTAQSALIQWQAPTPRARGKGPFVPPPKTGSNIFQGEARQWLANAIEQLGGDSSPLLVNPAIEDYLDRLGKFLTIYSRTPGTKFRFILTENDVPGATSIGDGRIYISLGLLRVVESEDELAGAIAHEMAHDAYNHVARTLTRQLYWLAGVKKVNSAADVDAALVKLSGIYEKNKLAMMAEKISGISRLDELKADHEAFYTTYRAGYNPRALILLLKRIEQRAKEDNPDTALIKFKQLIFGSHPLMSHRAFALDWEAGFVKLPPKETHYDSTGFQALKAELAKLGNPE